MIGALLEICFGIAELVDLSKQADRRAVSAIRDSAPRSAELTERAAGPLFRRRSSIGRRETGIAAPPNQVPNVENGDGHGTSSR
jgi:hypothetical protein